MNATPPRIHCSVSGADKLPADVGGVDGVCVAIDRGAGPLLSKAGISAASAIVKVQVVSSSAAAATLTVNGKTSAEHHVGSSDRSLNGRAFTMLGESLAAEIAAKRD